MHLAILLCGSIIACVFGSDVFVTIKQGKLRGTRTVYSSNQHVDHYQGIPYGQPPTGNLRFKAPLPALGWTGVRDATAQNASCPQGVRSNAYENEDCLFLNVFTPTANTTKPLSVMVYIHGGGFYKGNGYQVPGQYLAMNSLVIVTINYRWGLLGFLSTEDDAAPGNFGMLDQVLALKWVRDNVAAFGGNPNDVTIHGLSAGSASTSLHLLSPLSRGLFHAAIMSSGFSLSPWAKKTKTDNPSPLDEARQIGAKVNCKQSDTTLLVQCLRGLSVIRLISVQTRVTVPGYRDIPWSPVVGDSFGFLPELPANIIHSGKAADVPTMRGVARNERIAPAAASKDIVTAKVYVDLMVSKLFGPNKDIEDAIDNVYLTNANPRDSTQLHEKLGQILSDAAFYVPALLESENQANRSQIQDEASPCRRRRFLCRRRKPSMQRDQAASKTFLFEFDYKSTKTRAKNPDVPHAYSKQFVFGYPFINTRKYSDKDRAMSTVVMGMWANFVKTKNPSYGDVTWEPFDASQKSYLSINDTCVMKSDPRPQETHLWNVTVPDILGWPIF